MRSLHVEQCGTPQVHSASLWSSARNAIGGAHDSARGSPKPAAAAAVKASTITRRLPLSFSASGLSFRCFYSPRSGLGDHYFAVLIVFFRRTQQRFFARTILRILRDALFVIRSTHGAVSARMFVAALVQSALVVYPGLYRWLRARLGRASWPPMQSDSCVTLCGAYKKGYVRR